MREHGSRATDLAVARLSAARLVEYPDERLLGDLELLRAATAELAEPLAESFAAFFTEVGAWTLTQWQAHYVELFDMRRKACPYLSYWKEGDTRNRGMALVRFKQAYAAAGFALGNEELADHLSVVLEFTAQADRLTGEALLVDHQDGIMLLRAALAEWNSPYAHVLTVVVDTLPEPTAELTERIAALAAAGPPAETVGLQPFGLLASIEPLGARR